MEIHTPPFPIILQLKEDVLTKSRVGILIQDSNLIVNHILNHFQQIYTTESNSAPLNPYFLNHHLGLSDADHPALSSLILVQEIINSIKSFKPIKTPSLDGFHPFFFQKFFQNTLLTIKVLFKDIFDSERIPSNLNQTFVSLIPKTNCLETITNLDL